MSLRTAISRLRFILLPLLLTPTARSATPENASGGTDAAPLGKQIVARHILHGSVDIDGDLSDSVWTSERFTSDFVQREPVEGGAPSESTEIAVAYDDEALYFAARLSSAAGGALRDEVTRRDDYGSVERLCFSLDTWHDRRSAYTFVVTAAGGRADYYQPDDQSTTHDYSFDPVWEARTRRTANGWQAEIRVPFSQLRFNDAGDQVWGINVTRWIPGNNEDDYWVLIPKDQTAWASRFGSLVGISDVHLPLRAEVMPYAGGQMEYGTRNGDDPGRSGFVPRAGVDLKVGIGPALSLAGTVNPDFGQVELDPAQINLTDFEIVQQERRPFFVEGANLFAGGGATFYYSRRIGGPPHLWAPGEVLDAPANTTILGAAKLTGRTAGGLSIGAMAALGDREFARTRSNAGIIDTLEIEPRTGYAAVRLVQEFGGNHSTVGATLTGVARDMAQGSLSDDALSRSAVTGGADASLRFGSGEWKLDMMSGGSYVRGSQAAILRLQRSSARYFQRPDAGYVSVDSTRTSLAGFVAGTTIARISGAWQGYVKGRIESPGLELNDIGKIGSADEYALDVHAAHLWTEPTSVYHSLRVDAGLATEWNHGWVKTSSVAQLTGTMTLPNFWIATASTFVNLPATSPVLSRGGPNVAMPLGLDWELTLSGDPADRIGWDFELSGATDVIGDRDVAAEAGVSAVLGHRWNGSLTAKASAHRDKRQYIMTFDSSPSGAPGDYDVFGRIDNNSASVQLRVGLALTTDASLDLYAEPYVSSVRYSEFGTIPLPGQLELRHEADSGATGPQPDFMFSSFRMNLVLRWEWLPGSTLYFVWQRDAERYQPDPGGLRASEVFAAFGNAGAQVIALKISYWLPMQ